MEVQVSGHLGPAASSCKEGEEEEGRHCYGAASINAAEPFLIPSVAAAAPKRKLARALAGAHVRYATAADSKTVWYNVQSNFHKKKSQTAAAASPGTESRPVLWVPLVSGPVPVPTAVT